MIAGTQNHLKAKRLMRKLGIPSYRAVGLLESIWLLCAECCDEGNIGKFTDEEIAEEIGWLARSLRGAPLRYTRLA
jgi:hypothetical protein